MNDTYDPLVAHAALRGRVELRDGREGTLIYWNPRTQAGRVWINGRRYSLTAADIVTVDACRG